jgi:succinate dehydrogenase / fumarate reductase, membrane anchor subunit
MVKPVIVGAHYGLKDWLAQRVSALILAAGSLLFAAMLLVCAPSSHAEWRALFAPSWMRLASLVFFIALAWHAWIGMRDILMDYVKSTGVRLALEVMVLLTAVVYVAWAAEILWS